MFALRIETRLERFGWNLQYDACEQAASPSDVRVEVPELVVSFDDLQLGQPSKMLARVVKNPEKQVDDGQKFHVRMNSLLQN